MDYMDYNKEEKAMKERPILFNGDMVRAILEGRKTQTRRPIKDRNNILPKGNFMGIRQGGQWCTNPNPNLLWAQFYTEKDVFFIDGEKNINPHLFKCPFGQPGDRLWVRETWYYESHLHELTAGEPDLPSGRYSHRYIYRASNPDYPVNVGVGEHGWKPSIHMPRRASRILLENDEILVERVQDITNAAAEGFNHTKDFINTWNQIYSSQGLGWDANIPVWVVKFHVVEEVI
jgi:hypothetical protein